MQKTSIDHHAYTYLLPEEKIARFPLPERDASRLLVYKDGQITDACFLDLARYLPEKALLVLNNTRVVEARIIFQKPSGGHIELFALEPGPHYHDIALALRQQGSVDWQCLVGGASKWKHGQVLHKTGTWQGNPIELTASVRGKSADSFLITFQWTPAFLSFAEILHALGSVPLPPYIKRVAEESDRTRYQTIFANQEGSVAAPTAGLHFTDRVFESLTHKQIEKTYITLHVGAGTFKPVKGALHEHEMHAEFIEVNKETIRKLAASPEIFSVGTTSLRTLESLFHLGVKAFRNPLLPVEEMKLEQWEVYENPQHNGLTKKEALEALLDWMNHNGSEKIITTTRLLIVPGYRFRMVKGLITNFHQPQSTLLLLVAAMIGDDWKKVYGHALEKNYRFLSYGDACLFFTGSPGNPA